MMSYRVNGKASTSLGWLLVLVVLSINTATAVQPSRLGFQANTLLPYDGRSIQFWLQGESERSFLFFDVYDIAYYHADAGLDSSTSVLPELLYIKYERSLKSEKVKEALLEGFQNNLSSEQWDLYKLEALALLRSAITDVAEGDELKILKLESDLALFLMNDHKVAELKHSVLVPALWAIWLGERSVVSRHDLLGLE